MSLVYKLISKVGNFVYQKNTILFLAREKDFDIGGIGSNSRSNSDSRMLIQRALWRDYQDSCAESSWLENKKADAVQRLKQGHQLYLARREGRLVHVLWVRVSDLVEATYELGAGAEFGLDSPAPIIYDTWTAEEARGQGVYQQVLRFVVAALHETHAKIWVYCGDKNIASRIGLERVGFKVNRSITSLLIFRIPTRLWFKDYDD